MYASRDRLSDNLRGLRRHDVPVLENNMRLMEERQGLATETKEIECFKATLVKMEAMKEHVCTQHKLFSVRLLQDEGKEGKLREDELAEMNKTVVWLRSICSMTQEQWVKECNRMFRAVMENPDMPIYVACFGATIGGIIGALAGKGALGTAVAGCCGVNATASWGAFAMYVGIGAVGMAGIGLAVAAICYAIYKRRYPTPMVETNDPQKFAELLKKMESHVLDLNFAQVTQDMKELMGGMDGCPQQECSTCRSDMLVCRHSPEARHDVACAVLPFDCRHPLCHDCATNHRIEKCPLPYCRARRV